MRLIDADALLAELNAINAPYRADINNAITNAPTIDLVKHGRWEDKSICDGDAIEEWQEARCSACGLYHTTPYMYYFDKFRYCPNCGARMDGDDNEID